MFQTRYRKLIGHELANVSKLMCPDLLRQLSSCIFLKYWFYWRYLPSVVSGKARHQLLILMLFQTFMALFLQRNTEEVFLKYSSVFVQTVSQ